jgi:two-component system, NtrC family, sensor histidine kinase GlrK
VRLTIFWRIIFAQVSLVVLTVVVNFYMLSQLDQLTRLTETILTTDAAGIEEKKRLLQILLSQLRNAEKFLLFQDKPFYNQFIEGKHEFDGSLAKLATLVTNSEELALLGQIQHLHAQYVASIAPEAIHKPMARRDRTELSDGITARVHKLIQLREEAIVQKMASARDQSAMAARVIRWVTFGGIGFVIFFAFLHARCISRPLRKLAQELRLVGNGEFRRHLDIQSPAEVAELSGAFNWMASQLAKLDEMKEDFMANISHELRTPLTAIREGTTLLWEGIPDPLTASQREIVHVVRSHGERLNQFLSSVLDLSKMEAGMMEYVKMPRDLLPLLESTVQTVHLTAQRKGIHLESVYPDPLPTLGLDEERMQQALDNLLSNAMKFTPEGGTVRVTAALRRKIGEVGGDQWVEVRISDTGVGIPPEETERIFQKFYQSPHHQNRRERGTGLGLAIARHIVEAHGGMIWVESQLGKGSTFILLLPAHAAAQAQSTRSQLAMDADAAAVPRRVREGQNA